VLRGGKGDHGRTTPGHVAQAVAVRNGRFGRIGDDATISHRRADTQVVELAGKTVVPGRSTRICISSRR